MFCHLSVLLPSWLCLLRCKVRSIEYGIQYYSRTLRSSWISKNKWLGRDVCILLTSFSCWCLLALAWSRCDCARVSCCVCLCFCHSCCPPLHSAHSAAWTPAEGCVDLLDAARHAGFMHCCHPEWSFPALSSFYPSSCSLMIWTLLLRLLRWTSWLVSLLFDRCCRAVWNSLVRSRRLV